MKTPSEKMKLTVQETLDELFSEHLIPFQLTAYNVQSVSPDEFSVPFYDSRCHSVSFSLKTGGSFKDTVRSAVLERVSRLSGPLCFKAS